MKPCLLLLLLALVAGRSHGQGNPIVFVTQTPTPNDFTTVVSTFGNHRATLGAAPRGGDLWIRYPDGNLKNLTASAGFGEPGEHQGADAIAVRDPAVHWSGEKVAFSMVVGAPSQRYQVNTYRWQLYEVTGLAPADTPVIAPVPNQPAGFNNISPAYGTDGRLIFTSDRPRDAAGSAHLYPQLDEYEEQATVTGLWSLDPATGDLFLMEHSPSGSFDPVVDSFGRVLFTRWDHLQRDQQADGDALSGQPGGVYGTFDYSDESAAATPLFDTRVEVFPEPRAIRTDLLAGTPQLGLRFNLFFPWMIAEDGTGMETLNHIGRHELHDFFGRSFSDDPALEDFIAPAGRANPNPIENFFQIAEDPVQPGRYFGVDAPEFQTHGAGMLISLDGAPSANPDDMVVSYRTHPETGDVSESPSPSHSGLYRDPLPTSDGLVFAVHTAETRADANAGTVSAPASRYDFRIRRLAAGGDGYLAPAADLTPGISRTLTWWSPDFLISYSGPLWELQPVELRPRPIPTAAPHGLPAIESQVIEQSGAGLENLQAYLESQGLALLVVRDATTRDDADSQQPYRLRVDGDPGTPPGSEGDKIYDVKYLQFFQGDQLRGKGMRAPTDLPSPGRRVLARPMHEGSVLNQAGPSAPAGAVELAADGSAVAIVPARRALSWQLTDAAGGAVVRERFWLSFQPGEVRSCTSCHGLNKTDHAGQSEPQNTPQALGQLLQAWADSPSTEASMETLPGPGGATQVSVSGLEGLKLRLQTSTNLIDWDDLGQFQLGADGHTQELPPAMSQSMRRFFRVVPPASASD